VIRARAVLAAPMVGGDWAPEIPVSSLSLVQCGAAIAGAMEEGSSIAESTARSRIAAGLRAR